MADLDALVTAGLGKPIDTRSPLKFFARDLSAKDHPDVLDIIDERTPARAATTD